MLKSKKNIFKTPPQQSDYVIRWDNNDLEQKVFISKKIIFKMIKKVTPSLIKDIIKKILNGIYLLKRGIGLYDSEGLKRIQ